jgi:ketosteroid isomerase-like protein
VLALERHGMVAVARTFGTPPEGGAFENCGIGVATVERGRVTRFEFFEIEQLAAALARLAELRPDALRIPPNAATRAGDLRHAAWQARDWDALRALASPDFVFEDRSKISRVSGDVEMWIENNRFVAPAPVERELIATAGDRVALERVLWRGEPDGAPVEREHLRLTEVDAEGRIRASLRFDPDDRAAAFEEVQARFVAGEAAASGGQAPIATLFRAFTRRDWESMRSCLAEDAVIWDRRALGILGTLDREQWVESLRAAADLAPDWDAEVVRILTWNELGRVHLARMFGTRDGGPFENVVATVILVDRDRIQRYEIFDVADAGRALTRFEELCAGMRS